jgi:hypothetical protein
MASDAPLLNGRDHRSGDRIDDSQAPGSLLGHKQAVLLRKPGGNGQGKQKKSNGQSTGLHESLHRPRNEYISKRNQSYCVLKSFVQDRRSLMVAST